jgi:hypothetical protein
VVTLLGLGRLRYHEVDELRAGFKRTVGDRRSRIANNLRVRRASVALSKASDIHQIFEAVKVMLEFDEFAYANAQLGHVGHADLNFRVFKAGQQHHPVQDIEFRNGRIAWSWKRNDLNGDQVIGSGKYWCVRLPLSTEQGDWGWMNLYRPLNSEPLLLDMNYLTDVFRADVAQAASRVFQSFEKHSHAEDVTPAKAPLTMTVGNL